MADKVKASPEWESDAVVKRLQEAAAPGRPVSAQVFLKDDVSDSELSSKAQEIVDHASASLKLKANAVTVGKIHRLAKSFSVTSDVPHVFDAIAKRDDVKSILESVQSDILPQPLNKKDVP
jgi:hypothetical protein